MESQEILEIIEKQRKFHRSGQMRTFSERRKALKRLYKNIKLKEKDIYAALKKDLNKSEVESYMSEIGLSLSEIRFMLRHGRKYSRKKRVRTPIAHFPARSYKIPCPYGCVLVISPWNYPFMLSMRWRLATVLF